MKLRFSVVLSATGNLLDSRWWPCESTLGDIIRQCEPLDPEGHCEPSEPGDSEYSYLAGENSPSGLVGAAIAALDGGERKVGFAQWAADRWENDRDLWWALCSDYQVFGMLDGREFFQWLQDVDVIFEDCGTMGTLGGPLGGCVPDVAFTSESQAAIVSMRATPFIEHPDGSISPVTDATWERLKQFYRDPWAINNWPETPSPAKP